MTAGDTKYEDRFVDNYEAWNPDLSFYVEVGSIFVFDSELPDVDELILNCIEKLCNHNWSWSYDDFTIFAPDEKGKSVMPDGTRVMATDVRRRVWIHFDSKDDAMLSRITVVDLRSAKHADGGRLPTGTGPTLD